MGEQEHGIHGFHEFHGAEAVALVGSSLRQTRVRSYTFKHGGFDNATSSQETTTPKTATSRS